MTYAAGMLLYGFVVLFARLPYEQREIPIYRRACKLLSRLADSKIESTVCLENFGAAGRLVLRGGVGDGQTPALLQSQP